MRCEAEQCLLLGTCTPGEGITRASHPSLRPRDFKNLRLMAHILQVFHIKLKLAKSAEQQGFPGSKVFPSASDTASRYQVEIRIPMFCLIH